MLSGNFIYPRYLNTIYKRSLNNDIYVDKWRMFEMFLKLTLPLKSWQVIDLLWPLWWDQSHIWQWVWRFFVLLYKIDVVHILVLALFHKEILFSLWVSLPGDQSSLIQHVGTKVVLKVVNSWLVRHPKFDKHFGCTAKLQYKTTQIKFMYFL